MRSGPSDLHTDNFMVFINCGRVHNAPKSYIRQFRTPRNAKLWISSKINGSVVKVPELNFVYFFSGNFLLSSYAFKYFANCETPGC